VGRGVLLACLLVASSVTVVGGAITAEGAAANPLGSGNRVAQPILAAGFSHTCALPGSGTMSCWGVNDMGELGDGTTTNGASAVDVQGVTAAVAVAAGDAHTCVVIAGGTVSCWGSDSNGQLGASVDGSSTSPVVVSGISGAVTVAAGGAHSCALLAGGTVQCWGSNANGQLGNNSTTDSSTPVVVSGLTGAVAITAGGASTCALLANGTVKCWGLNTSGQLGDNTTTQRLTPVAVHGVGNVGTLGNVIAVEAGSSHTCALLASGTVKCWGQNLNGELGNGTSGNSSHTPVAVSGVSGATGLAVGESQLARSSLAERLSAGASTPLASSAMGLSRQAQRQSR